mmetsp:Transcript_15901/g.41867  ORF Transcript_15901/g.41867 Transcript_15901/m.41867 type:complete len:209 (+) Transcript_15901:697-1323(+)
MSWFFSSHQGATAAAAASYLPQSLCVSHQGAAAAAAAAAAVSYLPQSLRIVPLWTASSIPLHTRTTRAAAQALETWVCSTRTPCTQAPLPSLQHLPRAPQQQQQRRPQRQRKPTAKQQQLLLQQGCSGTGDGPAISDLAMQQGQPMVMLDKPQQQQEMLLLEEPRYHEQEQQACQGLLDPWAEDPWAFAAQGDPLAVLDGESTGLMNG